MPFLFASTGLYILLFALSGLVLASMWGKKKYDVRGKYCYITGGSSGLGRCLAIELVKRGANVTIVARTEPTLQSVAEELRAIAPPDQKINFVSADLTTSKASSDALDTAMEQWGGRAPDHVYLVAGMSEPRFFIDATPEQLQDGLDRTYWVAAWTAHAALKQMIANRVKGKVVFVGSFLSYTSFAGYACYSPGKYAMRGLADALRSEMLLHDIDIHLFCAAGIDTPGYEHEQKSKPVITLRIEKDDVVHSPEDVCKSMMKGLDSGHYAFANLWVTDAMRPTSAGAVPGAGIADFFWTIVSLIGVPIWRIMTDAEVRKAAPAVHKELEQRGFYKAPKGPSK